MSDPVDAIAVVGMSCRFPGADDPERFWANLAAGVESISTFDRDELRAAGADPAVLDHPGFVPRGGVLSDIDRFDAAYFGYSPREAELIDPQQRLFLECAAGALDDSGYDPARFGGVAGIYAGVGLSSYMWNNIYPSESELADVSQMQMILSVDKDYLATRAAYKLDLRGPAVTVQSACSTSMVAIHLACQGLLTGECDLALAGGASLILPEVRGYVYEEGGVLSPDGHCRSFDAAAKGTVPGSGVGVVVLRRLEDALADGDTIHAIVRGSAMNNDGSAKVGYTAPGTRGQTQVITDAVSAAGVEADTIGYVETHGAATPLGDPIEMTALADAFRALGASGGHRCAIGSLKSNIGHLDSAAGVAGFIKSVLMVKHGKVPPSLHFREPNPNIDFASTPFYVNRELSDWPVTGTPRRAGMSSFGIGGTNAHIVVEEPPPPRRRGQTAKPRPVLLSARTPAALERATDRLAEHLRAHPELSLADVAGTLAAGRRVHAHRRAVVAADTAGAAKALESRSPEVFTSAGPAGTRSVVFLFSGVGDQYPNLCSGLYRDEPVFRAELDRCAELFAPHLGFDLRERLFAAPAEPPRELPADPLARMLREREAGPLDETIVAQPLLFSVQYAMARLWMHYGVRPDALLGYSVGEYVAAAVAGVFSLADAAWLVARRARHIGGLPGGALLAVMNSAEQVEPLLEGQLSLSAVDAPSLCVVGGPAEEVDALAERLLADGIASRRVPAEHAFHTAMMRPLEESLRADFAGVELKTPEIPYLSNVTGQWVAPAEAADPAHWARHSVATVRFSDQIAAMWQLTAPVVVELGPGRALGSLLVQHPDRADDGLVLASSPAAHDRADDRTVLLEALSRAWLAGVEVDWAKLHANGEWGRASLPGYPFERAGYWLSARAPGKSGAAAPVTGRQADPADWFHLPDFSRSLPPRAEPDAAAGETWLVAGDAASIAEEVAARSAARVIRVSWAEEFADCGDDRYTLDPGDLTGWLSLLRGLKGAAPGRVVFGADGPQWDFTAFHGLVLLMRAWTECGLVDDVEIGVLSVSGLVVAGETEVRPERGMTAALCRVIGQELPQARCRFVDTAPPASARQRARLLTHLHAEIVAGTDDCVAYRGDTRWVRGFVPARLEATGATRLREGGCYLVSGGLGRIGAVIGDLLAARRARIGVIRRSAVPARDHWDSYVATADPDDSVAAEIAAIRRLEAAGATVATVAADVADDEGFAAAVAKLEQELGPFDGVFHVAGVVTADGVVPLAQATPESAEPHLAAKARGVRVLAGVFSGRELDFVLLCSSIASVLGGIGFSAYAAANLYLELFAAARSADGGTPWTALAWEGWTVEGDDAAAATLREYLIDEADATAVLDRVLAGSLPAQLVNSTGDLRSRFDQWSGDEAGSAPRRGGGHARPDLQTAYAAPVTDTEKLIAEVWAGLLGIDRVGLHDNFFELGGHSLLGTRVISRLLKELRVQVPLHTLLTSPTVAELAAAVAGLQDAPAAPSITRVDRGGYRRSGEAAEPTGATTR
ncbi:acyltransferase domain-containing protein [Amycolatopsis sp. FU40]|uniref:type I polyketide synthase n=1 Tax=Amycolatopsis sp. FU40 TaxID=2914159 RepID=UPI001F47563F|nr:type I polyketide synthase [Amycolatopsis sp. FU40]UKD56907.1 acyltransferase domain-containing protein [Amycolatopsis sp. FU40]